MDELSKAMKTYIDILAKIKALKEEKDELRTEMLLILKTNDLDAFEDEDNMLLYTMNKRRSFDKENAIEFITEKGGDANAFFTESDYETLKVKAKGGKTE